MRTTSMRPTFLLLVGCLATITLVANAEAPNKDIKGLLSAGVTKEESITVAQIDREPEFIALMKIRMNLPKSGTTQRFTYFAGSDNQFHYAFAPHVSPPRLYRISRDHIDESHLIDVISESIYEDSKVMPDDAHQLPWSFGGHFMSAIDFDKSVRRVAEGIARHKYNLGSESKD